MYWTQKWTHGMKESVSIVKMKFLLQQKSPITPYDVVYLQRGSELDELKRYPVLSIRIRLS